MSWFSFFRRRKPAVATAPRDADERRYVADVPYLLPKDLGETNRLDFQHYMLRYALKGNYAAPLEDPRDILDVGSGTGRWGMDMAQQFSAARIVGMDVTPPPVEANATPLPSPANYSFVQGNVLERVPFPDDSFDFIHQRFLTLAVPTARWPGVVAELLRVTRPGGWVELVETAPPMGAPAMDQLARWGIELTQRRGIDISLMARIGDLLRDGGATQVTARTVSIPVGKPNGRIGAMAAVDYLTALSAVRGPVTKLGIVDEATYDAMMARGRQEFDQGVFLQPVYLAFGCKP
ncbi:MAG TPA: class I SAM-dependent methyltransferase [Ktedonobacterales bacterium]|nr:class I SAM-dependent methyltransferase [Ktedonobacterales bacterium]